ncbi:MAG: hypothetical protein IJS75_04140 [Bacteroidales bacterium]|nr:hypothetical protein [Bacteroidales bacterium]
MENENASMIIPDIRKFRFYSLIVAIAFFIMGIVDVTDLLNSTFTSVIVSVLLWFFLWVSICVFFNWLKRLSRPNALVIKSSKCIIWGIGCFILSDLVIFFTTIYFKSNPDSELALTFFKIYLYVFGLSRIAAFSLFIFGLFRLSKCFSARSAQKIISIALASLGIFLVLYTIIWAIDPTLFFGPFVKIIYGLFYLCFIAFITLVSIPECVKSLFSNIQIATENVEIEQVKTSYSSEIINNSETSGLGRILMSLMMIMLSALLLILSITFRIELRYSLEYSFPPVLFGVLTSLVCILMIALMYRAKKFLVLTGQRKSIGGSYWAFFLSLIFALLFLVIDLILITNTNKVTSISVIEPIYVLSIIVSVLFLVTVLFGFVSASSPADYIGVLALICLLPLILLSDPVNGFIQGHTVIGSFCDEDYYRLPFILFSSLSLVSGILYILKK